jgi:hypothetical protein
MRRLILKPLYHCGIALLAVVYILVILGLGAVIRALTIIERCQKQTSK